MGPAKTGNPSSSLRDTGRDANERRNSTRNNGDNRLVIVAADNEPDPAFEKILVLP